MGQPTETNDTKALSQMSSGEIKKKIRDMYQLRREVHENISNCKRVFELAGEIIDVCEAELRERGHL